MADYQRHKQPDWNS